MGIFEEDADFDEILEDFFEVSDDGENEFEDFIEYLTAEHLYRDVREVINGIFNVEVVEDV